MTLAQCHHRSRTRHSTYPGGIDFSRSHRQLQPLPLRIPLLLPLLLPLPLVLVVVECSRLLLPLLGLTRMQGIRKLWEDWRQHTASVRHCRIRNGGSVSVLVLQASAPDGRMRLAAYGNPSTSAR